MRLQIASQAHRTPTPNHLLPPGVERALATMPAQAARYSTYPYGWQRAPELVALSRILKIPTATLAPCRAAFDQWCIDHDWASDGRVLPQDADTFHQACGAPRQVTPQAWLDACLESRFLRTWRSWWLNPGFRQRYRNPWAHDRAPRARMRERSEVLRARHAEVARDSARRRANLSKTPDYRLSCPLDTPKSHFSDLADSFHCQISVKSDPGGSRLAAQAHETGPGEGEPVLVPPSRSHFTVISMSKVPETMPETVQNGPHSQIIGSLFSPPSASPIHSKNPSPIPSAESGRIYHHTTDDLRCSESLIGESGTTGGRDDCLDGMDAATPSPETSETASNSSAEVCWVGPEAPPGPQPRPTDAPESFPVARVSSILASVLPAGDRAVMGRSEPPTEASPPSDDGPVIQTTEQFRVVATHLVDAAMMGDIRDDLAIAPYLGRSAFALHEVTRAKGFVATVVESEDQAARRVIVEEACRAFERGPRRRPSPATSALSSTEAPPGTSCRAASSPYTQAPPGGARQEDFEKIVRAYRHVVPPAVSENLHKLVPIGASIGQVGQVFCDLRGRWGGLRDPVGYLVTSLRNARAGRSRLPGGGGT